MGREVRRVPKYWNHPREPNGSFRPMFDIDYDTVAKEWQEEFLLWAAGNHPDQKEHKDTPKYFWEWNGEPPDKKDYFPKWDKKERTHFQMYETTTEGTPISPVMETPEELAKWLFNNKASAFAGQTASYESWLRVAKGGFACSAILKNGVVINGVEGSE